MVYEKRRFVRKANGKRYGPYRYLYKSVREGDNVRSKYVGYIPVEDLPERYTVAFDREGIDDENRTRDGVVRRSIDLYDSGRWFVTFDTETTGFSPDKGDMIIEVTAIKYRVVNGRLQKGDEFYRLIDPGKKIPRLIQDLTHITPDMVEGRPTIKEVYPELHSFMWGHELMAHNAPFDLRHLRFWGKKFGYKRLPSPDRTIDTLALSRRMYESGREIKHNLQAVAERENVAPEGEFHSSRFDVEVTAQVWLVMTRKLKELTGRKRKTRLTRGIPVI